MKLYADRQDRLTRQIVFDALTLLWVGLWVWAGLAIYHRTTSAKSGTRDLSSGGQQLHTQMGRAADAAGGVPLVGGALKSPLRQAAGAGTSMDHAGQQLGDVIETLGRVMGSLTAGIPIAFALLIWLTIRLPYARRAGRARSLARRPGGIDLLALQALSSAAPAQLLAIDPEPAQAWRDRDESAIAAFAQLQLRRLGLE